MRKQKPIMTNQHTIRQPRLRIRLLLIAGFVLSLLGLILLNLLRSPEASTGTSADPRSAALVARGKQVYAQNCASCHGVNLEGQPNWQQPLATGGHPAPPHDVTGHTWHHDDESLFTTVKYGGQATAPAGYISNMPAFSSLPDDDIWAVLAYIKSMWPPEIQAAQQQGHQ